MGPIRSCVVLELAVHGGGRRNVTRPPGRDLPVTLCIVTREPLLVTRNASSHRHWHRSLVRK